ncbi:uncharacterized protein ACLA_025330 [Aspergillus clavatus NRRL 1]|uniref:Pre-mRNA splicing factor Clf1 n=1 Tax=Aspergillus clavatus (strain ATCC 1007 / CBS 513.65 / DSM 816 / NCTC 3887 / NRRL 1 / QM 1276 / 107) TaxID=344612 RepID=A1CQ95_ASPCL|nr:uncharacterized protein ACLA_025330 [Aspergillus clavatus NRRL 1]EAW07816.1 conserved hypothetical protein [Aspergillus clavatus NRRL 1]
MAVPEPPVKLEGHCSVIHNNTLYTYSANGFAAIPLERNGNGTWRKLPMGEPVSDAVCVTGTMDGKDDQHALYVIGGSSNDENAPGLQRYAFESREWTTMQTQHQMENRTSHTAVFLKSPPVLLVYAGNQRDREMASSDTFTINTAPPYNISSYSAKIPAISPVLLPWSDSEAALVGGRTAEKEVHLFTAAGGWASSQVSLAQPVSGDVRCAIVNGDDGSKALEIFNMKVSPNTVSSIALLNRGGIPAPPGTLLGESSSRKRKRREISLDNYPAYDGALASSTTRSDYSLAQGDNGLVVISSDSGTDSLAIFNQTSNSWVNATKLFYGDDSPQQILPSIATTPSATPSTTTSATASASASSAASGETSGNRVGTILGATLGSLVGVILILILILFFLHRTKLGRKRAGPGAAGHGGSPNDKDRLSFQDQGMEPLTRSAYPMAKDPAPLAATSVDSLAIFSGKMADEKSGHAPKPTPLKPTPLVAVQSTGERTPSSTYSFGVDGKAVEAQDMVGNNAPRDRAAEEGWGRYFQDDGTTIAANSPVFPPPMGARSKAEDRTSAWPGPHTLPPLNLGFLEEPKPLGRVVTGSPTTENGSPSGSMLRRAESQSARISSASSISATSEHDYGHHQDRSYGFANDTDSGRHDGVSTTSVPPPDPSWRGAAQHSWIGRPPSSAYSRSFYDHGDRGASTINTRGSSVLIPDPLAPMPPTNQRKNLNSDLSWLNLNADK